MQMNYSMIDTKRFLILLRKNIVEQKNEIADVFGKHPMVESVSCLNNGSFMINATCCDFDQFFQLEAFFRKESKISIDASDLADYMHKIFKQDATSEPEK